MREHSLRGGGGVWVGVHCANESGWVIVFGGRGVRQSTLWEGEEVGQSTLYVENEVGVVRIHFVSGRRVTPRRRDGG